MEPGILGFGIRNTAQGIPIPLTIGIRNPSSTDKEKGVQYLESGIQDWNPESKTVLTCVADVI